MVSTVLGRNGARYCVPNSVRKKQGAPNSGLSRPNMFLGPRDESREMSVKFRDTSGINVGHQFGPDFWRRCDLAMVTSEDPATGATSH